MEHLYAIIARIGSIRTRKRNKPMDGQMSFFDEKELDTKSQIVKPPKDKTRQDKTRADRMLSTTSSWHLQR